MTLTLTDLKPDFAKPSHLSVKVEGINNGRIHWERWPDGRFGYRRHPTKDQAHQAPRRPQIRATSLLTLLTGPDFNLPVAHAAAVIGKMNLRRFAAKTRHLNPRRARQMGVV